MNRNVICRTRNDEGAVRDSLILAQRHSDRKKEKSDNDPLKNVDFTPGV